MVIEQTSNGGFIAILYDGTVIELAASDYADAVCEADMLL